MSVGYYQSNNNNNNNNKERVQKTNCKRYQYISKENKNKKRH